MSKSLVEEPVNPVRKSYSGGAMNNPPFPKICPKPARESRLSKLSVRIPPRRTRRIYVEIYDVFIMILHEYFLIQFTTIKLIQVLFLIHLRPDDLGINLTTALH